MSPRPGGESDKLGNKFELAWAIYHALRCVLDDRCALTVEDNDAEVGQGSEFTYDTGHFIEVHQVKRQNGNSNGWTVRELADRKIFEVAAGHVVAGRHYHFVSLTPCRPLQELSERARKSEDLADFINHWLTGDLSAYFDQVSAVEVLASPQAAWDTLRGMWFSVIDEYHLICTNSMLAKCNFSGTDGRLISLAVGDVLLDNLGKRLTRTKLLDLLAERDITPLASGAYQSAREQVRGITEAGVNLFNANSSNRRSNVRRPINLYGRSVQARSDSSQVPLEVGRALYWNRLLLPLKLPGPRCWRSD